MKPQHGVYQTFEELNKNYPVLQHVSPVWNMVCIILGLVLLVGILVWWGYRITRKTKVRLTTTEEIEEDKRKEWDHFVILAGAILIFVGALSIPSTAIFTPTAYRTYNQAMAVWKRDQATLIEVQPEQKLQVAEKTVLNGAVQVLLVADKGSVYYTISDSSRIEYIEGSKSYVTAVWVDAPDRMLYRGVNGGWQVRKLFLGVEGLDQEVG